MRKRTLKISRYGVAISLFAVASVCISVHVSAAPPVIDAERHLKQAVSQVEAANWSAAIAAFEAAQATGAALPDSFAYHYGRALAKAKRYVEARIVLEGYLANQGAEARCAKPAQELLAEIRKQTSAQAREAAKAADAAQAATFKEREAQAEQAYVDGRYADALARFQVLGDQGSAVAQRRLGDLYLNGKGVPRDAAEAARWYGRAAEQNDLPALAQLGMLYQRGEGVRPDWKAAHRLLKQAAEGGNAYAMREFAFMVLDGRGQPANLNEALQWYRKAAEAGEANAAQMVGVIHEYYQQPPNLGEALRWYQRAADTGNAAAMYSLSTIYGDGRGVPQDKAAEQAWLDKAMAAGSGAAYQEMARRAFRQTPPDKATAEQWLERGVLAGDGECAYQLSRAKDDETAVKWLRRGAELRNPNACFALYLRTSQSQGRARDTAEADRLLRCAAELGHAEAMYRVGRSLPPAEAVPWYERAIRLRHAEAINAHGELLLNGDGVPRNPMLAEEHFKTAADLGSNAAYVNMGRVVEARDLRSAQRWYRAAAERGYPPAQRIYGEILLTEGMGLYRNDGLEYLRKAAAAKDAAAAFRLGQLYAAGQYVEHSNEQARIYFESARDNGHPEAAARLRELGELPLVNTSGAIRGSATPSQ